MRRRATFVAAPIIPPSTPVDPYWIEEYGTSAYLNLAVGASYVKSNSFVSGFGTYPAGEVQQIKVILQASARGYIKYENLSAFGTDVDFTINTNFDVQEICGVAVAATPLSPAPTNSATVSAYDGRNDYGGISGQTVFVQDIVTFTEVFDEVGGAVCAALNANAGWTTLKTIREWVSKTVNSTPAATINDGTNTFSFRYDVKIRTLFDASP